jgi:hypothetical protein
VTGPSKPVQLQLGKTGSSTSSRPRLRMSSLGCQSKAIPISVLGKASKKSPRNAGCSEPRIPAKALMISFLKESDSVVYRLTRAAYLWKLIFCSSLGSRSLRGSSPPRPEVLQKLYLSDCQLAMSAQRCPLHRYHSSTNTKWNLRRRTNIL